MVTTDKEYADICAKVKMDQKIKDSINDAINEFKDSTGLQVADVRVHISDITPIGSINPIRDYKFGGVITILGSTNY